MKVNFKYLCMLPFMALTGPLSEAQTFTTPIAHNYVLGNSTIVKEPVYTNCFSDGNVSIGGYTGDLYLASWGSSVPGAGAEVVWQLKAANNPAITLLSGSLPYDGVEDMNVSTVYDLFSPHAYLLVAYYKTGSGHYLDIYDIDASASAPVYNNTMTLSHSPDYGRIRMDNQGKFYAGIVWENPGVGLQTILCEGGSWSQIADIAGTADESIPDIAFSLAPGDLNVVFASFNKFTKDITVSYISENVISASPGTITPAISDVYNHGSYIDPVIVLDAPNGYPTGNTNWAYTFTNNADVFVRYLNTTTSPAAQTVSITNGTTLSNMPLTGQYRALAPTLCYAPGKIMVGWYALDGNNFNAYIGLEMNDNGSGLLSAPDYMQLPNSLTSAPYYNYRPNIALSRNTSWAWASNYRYATFIDMDEVSGYYHLHHAFHPINSVVFSSKTKLPAIDDIAVHVFPNPVSDHLNINIDLKEHAEVIFLLCDLNGRRIFNKTRYLQQGHHELILPEIKDIPAGSYLLNTYISGKKQDTKKITKI